MTGLVLDCSVTMGWLFRDGDPAYMRRVFDLLEAGATAYVPVLWRHEVTNGLVMAQRRKQASRAEIKLFLDRLSDFLIVCQDAAELVISDFLADADGAFASGLTAYDHTYLALAQELGLPLATLDKDLRKAAKAVGIADAVA